MIAKEFVISQESMWINLALDELWRKVNTFTLNSLSNLISSTKKLLTISPTLREFWCLCFPRNNFSMISESFSGSKNLANSVYLDVF